MARQARCIVGVLGGCFEDALRGPGKAGASQWVIYGQLGRRKSRRQWGKATLSLGPSLAPVLRDVSCVLRVLREEFCGAFIPHAPPAAPRRPRHPALRDGCGGPSAPPSSGTTPTRPISSPALPPRWSGGAHRLRRGAPSAPCPPRAPHWEAARRRAADAAWQRLLGRRLRKA